MSDFKLVIEIGMNVDEEQDNVEDSVSISDVIIKVLDKNGDDVSDDGERDELTKLAMGLMKDLTEKA